MVTISVRGGAKYATRKTDQQKQEKHFASLLNGRKSGADDNPLYGDGGRPGRGGGKCQESGLRPLYSVLLQTQLTH